VGRFVVLYRFGWRGGPRLFSRGWERDILTLRGFVDTQLEVICRMLNIREKIVVRMYRLGLPEYTLHCPFVFPRQ